MDGLKRGFTLATGTDALGNPRQDTGRLHYLVHLSSSNTLSLKSTLGKIQFVTLEKIDD